MGKRPNIQENRSISTGGHSLSTVERKSIKNQVFQQLRDQIISGVWAPGSKLPSENELCKQLGVSRVSVREVIHRLAALDIVETRQGEGTFVKKISSAACLNNVLLPALILGKRDLVEVLEYRKIMEVGAIEMAVENATQEDIDKLEEIMVRMDSDDSEEKRFALDDLVFHMTIARATKNQLIITDNDIIRDILNVSMKDIVHNLGRRDGKYYHHKILDALKRRDKQAAVDLMREHVITTIERIKENKHFKD